MQVFASEPEGGVGAQLVEVVGVFLPAFDVQDTGEQDLGQRVHDLARIASIRDHRSKLFGNTQSPGGLGEQHDATVRGQATAIEGGCELLAPHG